MWINRLTIHDYRAFQEKFDLTLSPNLTAIAGENGVGKSTLLAVLTNAGELAKYKTLTGKPFRGEFSQIIMFDKEHDSTGEKAEIYFKDLPASPEEYLVSDKISFRASKHKSSRTIDKYIKNKNSDLFTKKTSTIEYTRYRLIPVKTKDRNYESKVRYPTYYLGLSRLDPLGEFDTANSKKIPNKWQEEISKIHAQILGEDSDEIKSFANLDIGTRHSKANLATKYYGYESNSSGQDNTGQIVEAVLSFENLKETLSKESKGFVGGILAIDEIDATLHPAAQNRLIDWLLEESQKLNIQIVFTTHSLTLLEHLSKINKNAKNESVRINYLSTSKSKPGFVTCHTNPNSSFYRYNLHKKKNKNVVLPTVKIFTEDEVARWELRILLDQLNVKLPKYELINCNLSWNTMVNLIQADPEGFDNYIFILDADMNPNNENSGLYQYMHSDNRIINFQVNYEYGNVLTFPGNYALEKELWEFTNTASADSPLFRDTFLANHGITTPERIELMNTISVSNHNTNKDVIINKNSNSQDFKLWFNRNSPYMQYFLKYWMLSSENIANVKKFCGLLTSITKRIENNLKRANDEI